MVARNKLRRFTLYVLMFPNGKRYFGITGKPIEFRWRGHCCAARTSPKFAVHRAMAKFGIDQVEMRVLVIGLRRYIEDLEVASIAKFNTTDRRFGYNTALGGDHNPSLLPEVREKIGCLAKIRLSDPAGAMAQAPRGDPARYARMLSGSSPVDGSA